MEHDIEVGYAKPIRQRFYRIHPEKRKFLDEEIRYMLDNDQVGATNVVSTWTF